MGRDSVTRFALDDGGNLDVWKDSDSHPLAIVLPRSLYGLSVVWVGLRGSLAARR